MSTIVKTEAVVLKAMKYRETSKIVTFYTREFGKLSAIAKGARLPKNKFGASLEPMSYALLVLYKKEHRDLHLISQCDLLKSFRHLSEELDKMAVGMSVIELVDKVSHDEEANEKLFRLLIDVLAAVNTATKQAWNLLYGFEIRLATILGFQPNFERCAFCGREVLTEDGEPENLDSKQVNFHIGKGGPLCPLCVDNAGLKVKISVESLRNLKRLAAIGSMDAIADVEITERSKKEIEGLLLGFLRFHVDGLQTLKAEKVLSRILS